MKKLKAFLTALCLVLAILIINTPNINYGYGPGNVSPDYDSAEYDGSYEYDDYNDEAHGSDSEHSSE
ncbi:MAG: hypothetical protein FWE20_07225 [Defluviitaleaceae bacterium]|nr:hypothetical protein [Defluviitaleaceae bacterium]